MLPRRSLLLAPHGPLRLRHPLPPIDDGSSNPEAEALLQLSAQAHGLLALQSLNEITVRYDGEWRPLVTRLQPALIDDGFRGGSEQHLRIREGIIDQLHTGPQGQKARRTPLVPCWGKGHPWHDPRLVQRRGIQ